MEAWILIAVVAVIVVPLVLMMIADKKGMFTDIWGGPFSAENLSPPPGNGGSPNGTAGEREIEIRQFIEARNSRRVARGERPLDVDGEVARLMSLDPEVDPDAPPKVDGELREEVRQLVVARNERLIAKGAEPLDVETEVDRQLKDAGA